MMKLITCQRCGKQEMRHATARYCLDCKRIINRERTKQSYERKKKVNKTCESLVAARRNEL